MILRTRVLTGVVFLAALVLMLLPLASAQTAPSQPQDPTAQSPSNPAPSASSRSPHHEEQPTPDAGNSSTPSTTSPPVKTRIFMGTVIREKAGYVLRAGDLEFKLDNADKAAEYEGKSVKVTGNLDKQSNTIHVRAIENSPGL